MKAIDTFRFSIRSASGYPARTFLILLAMAIGVGAGRLLTALGEGARRYVTREFTSLGTHLLIVIPGRSETTGGPPPLLGETPRDLTLEDALALTRNSSIRRVAPIAIGSACLGYISFNDLCHLGIACVHMRRKCPVRTPYDRLAPTRTPC